MYPRSVDWPYEPKQIHKKVQDGHGVHQKSRPLSSMRCWKLLTSESASVKLDIDLNLLMKASGGKMILMEEQAGHAAESTFPHKWRLLEIDPRTQMT